MVFILCARYAGKNESETLGFVDFCNCFDGTRWVLHLSTVMIVWISKCFVGGLRGGKERWDSSRDPADPEMDCHAQLLIRNLKLFSFDDY